MRTAVPGGLVAGSAGDPLFEALGAPRGSAVAVVHCLGVGCRVDSSVRDYNFLSRLLQVAEAASEEREPRVSGLGKLSAAQTPLKCLCQEATQPPMACFHWQGAHCLLSLKTAC